MTQLILPSGGDLPLLSEYTLDTLQDTIDIDFAFKNYTQLRLLFRLRMIGTAAGITANPTLEMRKSDDSVIQAVTDNIKWIDTSVSSSSRSDSFLLDSWAVDTGTGNESEGILDLRFYPNEFTATSLWINGWSTSWLGNKSTSDQIVSRYHQGMMWESDEWDNIYLETQNANRDWAVGCKVFIYGK